MSNPNNHKKMKKIVMMMFAGLLSVSALADNVMFRIPNMHCQNCAKRVEKALKASEAVNEVSVDLENRTVCVAYDAQKATAEVLQQSLADARFKAEVAKQCDRKEGCARKADGARKCQKEGGEKKDCCEEQAAGM